MKTLLYVVIITTMVLILAAILDPSVSAWLILHA